MRLKNGLVQIYTGDGKGKTTAALGLAVRAVGAGLKVYIQQFIKGKPYSEISALKKLDGITLEQCGLGCFIKGRPKKKDIDAAEKGLIKAETNIVSGRFGLVILDEVNIALHLDLIELNDIIALIRNKPKHVELVLTGRSCPKKLLKYADLVTEMREVKHPYTKGIPARLGIEH